MKCASCGMELDESLKFCEGCGAPVIKATVASPPPPPPAPPAPAAPKAPPPAAPKAPPAPAPPKTPEAQKKKGGKCGCIAAIAIVVLLVLLALCVAAGYMKREWLKDKWESFRNRGEGSARIHAPANQPDLGYKALPKSFTV